MKKLISLSLLFLSPSLLADLTIEEREREVLLENKKDRNITQQEVFDFPEIHNYNHKLHKDLDDDAGVFTDTYFTRYDSGKLGLAYGFSVNIDDPGEIFSLDVSYMRAFENSWREYWWGLQAKLTRTEIEPVSDTLKASTDDIQEMIFYGVGLGHRFKTLGVLFDSDRLFEIVSVYVNYVTHRDNFAQEDYTGIGYNADYTISYRSSKHFYWGGKISYNWILVDQPAENGNKLSERSRVLGWSSIGFELGYIF